MSVRTLSQRMPQETSYGLTFFDQTTVSATYGLAPGWSGGAQCVTTVQRPSEVSKWTILGWGLAFQAACSVIPGLNSPVPCFVPVQPQLYGGLTRDSGLQEGPAPFTALPRDVSMLELLWDGAVDTPFPQASNSSPFVPGPASMRQKATMLPAPVELEESELLQVGFWLTPMLGQNFRIWIFNAIYTVIYDPTT